MSADQSEVGAAKVERLLAEMTLEEKIGQLTQYFYFSKEVAQSDLSTMR